MKIMLIILVAAAVRVEREAALVADYYHLASEEVV
jgi:hypothetical protein